MKRIPITKEIIGVVVIALLFILSAFLSHRYDTFLETYVGSYGAVGAVFYVLITIASTVFAPLNTFFLLPVAVALWGPFVAAILSIIGWTMGAVTAFLLARTFGYPLITRIGSIQKMETMVRRIPEQNIFFWIVLMRMAIPVDILSYALGLFLPVPLPVYTAATLIGVTPFAFIFSYAAAASGIYIIAAGIAAVVAVMLGICSMKKNFTK